MAADAYITLPEELFEGSGSSTFSGALDLPELKAGPDTFGFSRPLPWNVLVANTGEGSLLVSGSISGEARAACARCLREFDLPLDGEVEGLLFLSAPDAQTVEEMELDEDEYLVVGEDHAVDLTGFLQAALVLDAPLVPLHDEDCKGLCSQCGKDLNEGPCNCAHDEDPDFEAASNPFAALRDFKFDN